MEPDDLLNILEYKREKKQLSSADGLDHLMQLVAKRNKTTTTTNEGQDTMSNEGGKTGALVATRYRVNPIVNTIVRAWCSVCEGDSSIRVGLTATYVTIVSILSAIGVFLVSPLLFFAAVPLLLWGFVPEAMTRSLLKSGRAVCLPEFAGTGYKWQEELKELLANYDQYCDISLADDTVEKNREVFIDHEPEIWNLALKTSTVINRRRGKILEGEAQDALNAQYRKLHAAKDGVASLISASDTVALLSATVDIGDINVEDGVNNLHTHLGTLRELESGDYV